MRRFLRAFAFKLRRRRRKRSTPGPARDGRRWDAGRRAVRPGRFHVSILQNTGFGSFFGYEDGDPLVRVFDLRVEADQPTAAAEVVFAIANSYPGELVCDPRYGEEVAAYRAAGLRSLSVGDVVVVRDDAGDETSWACMPTGWIRLPATPACTNAL
jgi:hypothetical protein